MTDAVPAPDRPLVTFALFAYNQEQYIREAVEGAFAQTYEPLEIILSDDCSSDQTFEIMQRMAAAYNGPHEVRARRSSMNRGILNHVLEVAHEARGTFIVVAAGDDISRPERTNTLVDIAVKNDWQGLSSACDEFRDGNVEGSITLNTVKPIKINILNGSPIVQQIHGASSAYATSFLRGLPLPKEKVLLEDYVLQILLHIKGYKAGSVEHSLIFRRIHENNIGPGSLGRRKLGVLEMERKISDHYKRMLPSLKYIEQVEKEISSLSGTFNESAVEPDAMRYCALRACWMESSPSKRLQLASMSRKFGSPRRDMLRALGPGAFNILVSIAEKFHWRFVHRNEDKKG
jgi:glycosyltransferase involved in cell wall biosynthesis